MSDYGRNVFHQHIRSLKNISVYFLQYILPFHSINNQKCLVYMPISVRSTRNRLSTCLKLVYLFEYYNSDTSFSYFYFRNFNVMFLKSAMSLKCFIAMAAFSLIGISIFTSFFILFKTIIISGNSNRFTARQKKLFLRPSL